MKNTLLLPRYTSQCNISVFKLFTPIRPKIKHQATCLDLSQKSSSSNTPTSDYYLKHYHQPKCNQPGHKFVDEDQEKTSEQSTKLKIFGPWRLPLCSLLWWWSIFGPGRKVRKFGLWYMESCTTPYSTLLWCTQVTKNTQEYSYMNRYGCPPAEALLTNLPCLLPGLQHTHQPA